MAKVPIAVAYGDGIGPEIMSACLRILDAAGADLEITEIEVGEKVYREGFSSGIRPDTWDILQHTHVLYKAPITTPQGGGYKSLNVTIRNSLGLYANVRPSASYYPVVDTNHPMMDLVIVRENEEDLYAGIEHRQTAEVYQALKLITRPGTEKIVRYAFEFTKRTGRKKVTCLTKDNILKLSDGLFHKVFDEIATEYPTIEAEHMIIDIGTAKLAAQPEIFDVIVAPNLYGDILSDVASQLTGSVGLGVSSNIGDRYAMFEAVHGSAPDIAGRGIANPSGLLLAAVPMLIHLGKADVAERIHNAWKRTLEEGIHTPDIYKADRSKVRVGTTEFAFEVQQRLGYKPEILEAVNYQGDIITQLSMPPTQVNVHKELVGIDVFLDWDEQGRDPSVLGKLLEDKVNSGEMKLVMITNRGLKVYPANEIKTFSTDHWRCRFQQKNNGVISHKQILDLLQKFDAAGLDFIKTENLYTFDGEPAFSLGQGQ
ncbi:MAG: NADP-dependent isocitrate dehydrogenase [Anaerolineae bacterium]|nr:NADP-dependent isocitrate dehydrogenase [Anaerolineae bacterium]